jgi:hypothetical protein
VLRRSTFQALATALSVLFTTACAVRMRQSGSTATQAEREPPRIDVDAAFEEVRAGRAMLIDVRGPISYEERRAAGAILITLDDLEQKLGDSLARIPRDQKPILYCT